MHALRQRKGQQLIAADFASSRQQLLRSPEVKAGVTRFGY
jgi:hypothetical protein